MDDLTQSVQKKYAELERQEAELKEKLKEIAEQKRPLRSYLRDLGLIEVPKRNRKVHVQEKVNG